uniref:PH domain-containing protein n=1 Tax=Magallana gigas TaxID=29159 RepID=A0A8W8JVJ5_MAGGI
KMTSFHESIKEFISEVEKFLVETIKKEALSKTSKEHKQTILDKIGRLREEFPQFTPDKQSEDTKSADQSFTDESSRTGGSSNADDEDQYGDSNIPAIPAQDLTDTIKCGFLEKKQRKGGLFGGPKLQKRWCAIKHNIFYYYESAKERKQHGAFYLNGYYLEAAPEAVDKKDSARRELSFQLVCPAKRTYQFVALSKEDYDDWKVAISKGALSSSSRDNILSNSHYIQQGHVVKHINY